MKIKKLLFVIGVFVVYMAVAWWVWGNIIDSEDQYFNSENWKIPSLYAVGVLIGFGALRWILSMFDWEWLR